MADAEADTGSLTLAEQYLTQPAPMRHIPEGSLTPRRRCTSCRARCCSTATRRRTSRRS